MAKIKAIWISWLVQISPFTACTWTNLTFYCSWTIFFVPQIQKFKWKLQSEIKENNILIWARNICFFTNQLNKNKPSHTWTWEVEKSFLSVTCRWSVYAGGIRQQVVSGQTVDRLDRLIQRQLEQKRPKVKSQVANWMKMPHLNWKVFLCDTENWAWRPI